MYNTFIATDEDGCAVENVCNTLFKCIYNFHEEIFCLIVCTIRYNVDIFDYFKCIVLELVNIPYFEREDFVTV